MFIVFSIPELVMDTENINSCPLGICGFQRYFFEESYVL